MNVLIIGGGGREHAIAWKIAQDERVTKVYVAPGNGGTQTEAKCENIDIAVTETQKLITFAKDNQIDLTIVGPEAPLVIGVVDAFNKANLKILGPCQKAAQLEASKAFSKEFFDKFNIPTAAYATFTETTPAIEYIKKQGTPIVIKADGLAAGKGVIIAQTENHAIETVQDMLEQNKFGNAGAKVVIEEFLEGEEASYIVLCDGESFIPFASSQDHKAVNDGDQGPNTGGMGAYSPAPVITKKIEQKIIDTVIKPTIEGMKQLGHPYTGFLYAGLMINKSGDIKVLEYNCRLGDPETQPLLMRLKTSLLDLSLATINNQLAGQEIEWTPQTALGVVMAAGGYPENYPKGDEISGLDQITNPNCKIFHAGTKKENNQILTNGGRVLCVTALGDSVKSSQLTAYENVKKISWQNLHFRTDIGNKALEKNNATVL